MKEVPADEVVPDGWKIVSKPAELDIMHSEPEKLEGNRVVFKWNAPWNWCVATVTHYYPRAQMWELEFDKREGMTSYKQNCTLWVDKCIVRPLSDDDSAASWVLLSAQK